MLKTGKIKSAGTERLWNFPLLNHGKMGRVFTKHLMNLSFTLNPNHYALLSFLIYQSGYDNTIKYSNNLLKMYENAVKGALKEYKLENDYLYISLPKTRLYFKWLITEGFLMKAEGNIFLINPNLTYSKLYVIPNDYIKWVKDYNNGSKIKYLVNSYLESVQDNYKKKHNK